MACARYKRPWGTLGGACMECGATRSEHSGQPPTQWGVFDTKDNVWLGDASGPKVFDDEILARVSAQVTGVQMGYPPQRLRHREYRGDADRLRDTIETKMTPEEALKKIDEGDYE